jgi:hypothetical protein
MSEHKCQTCHWAKGGEGTLLLCTWPLPEWIMRELLNPLTGGGPLSNAVRPDSGVHCLIWKERDGGPV